MDIFSDRKNLSGFTTAGMMLGAIPGIGSALYVILANPNLVSSRAAVMLTFYILFVYLLAGAAAGIGLYVLLHVFRGRSPALTFFPAAGPAGS